ncbi:hypothetical protein HGG82_16040 [Marinomonas sp. M1K-6]|uniref:Yip1 domain-containing protein n=1 Tax=Marinomonas profundi TaxID=2726122 RepID=A0A847R9I6_9GAMM|nr:YIP1 family protein [Marinomonas profundi]NLQ19113.1 hypothetical protein [Marinomonas profundi]UDV02086.1 hypothetical protein J8N69_10815 [Marinomonas profundi]
MSGFEPDHPFRTLTPREENAKSNVVIAYVFMLLGIFTGVFWLIGAIWAMAKVAEARGTKFEDHYVNIISTFWWGIFWGLIGLVLALFFIGYIVLFAVWVWSIFRMVKGIARVTSNQSYRAMFNPF